MVENVLANKKTSTDCSWKSLSWQVQIYPAVYVEKNISCIVHTQVCVEYKFKSCWSFIEMQLVLASPVI